MSWMPSRELGERWPNLLAVGGHPAVDMPPHVVEAARRAARARAVRADARAAGAARGDRRRARRRPGAERDRDARRHAGPLPRRPRVRAARGHARAVVLLPAARSTPPAGSCAVAYDWDEYAAASAPETTLAIVNTPVNPTGYVFRAGRPRRDRRGARRQRRAAAERRGVLRPALRRASSISPPRRIPSWPSRTLVLRSFSKTLAMAAWRVGYAVGPEHGDRRARARAAVAGARDRRRRAVGRARRADRAARLDRRRRSPSSRRCGRAGDRRGERGRLPQRAARRRARSSGPRSTATRTRRATSSPASYGIPALPGRHFHARTPHLRIPFGGRADARAAFLERLSAARRPGAPR